MKLASGMIRDGKALAENTDGLNVLEAARARIRQLFDTYDTVTVSFSGGKDSTVVLMLCLDEARRRTAEGENRLPLSVDMFDEEVIDPDTVAYCEQVRGWADVDFHWFCVPVRHTLRAQQRDHWTTWDPAAADVWARDMPEGAITAADLPGYSERLTIRDALATFYGDQLKEGKRVVSVGGIRIQESFNRRRALIQSGGWIVQGHGTLDWAKPIFDWAWEDVWRAILLYEWPHSHFYDRLWMKGVSPMRQRVAPWGNVAATRETVHYPEFYPDFWSRVIRRLPEMRAQARYGDTKLFRKTTAKPTHLTWQEYAMQLLGELDGEDAQAFWKNYIGERLRRWARISTAPMPEDSVMIDDEKQTGYSWKNICAAIQKNDLIRDASGNLRSRDAL